MPDLEMHVVAVRILFIRIGYQMVDPGSIVVGADQTATVGAVAYPVTPAHVELLCLVRLNILASS